VSYSVAALPENWSEEVAKAERGDDMVAFVLGGGGSRGALQIGALEALFNESWLSFLKRQLPAERFSDLPLPCYAIAVEMKIGKATVFGDRPAAEDILT